MRPTPTAPSPARHDPAGDDGAIDAATRAIDAALFDIELELDWLARLSPTHNAARWHAFRASGFARAPALTYRPVEIDLDAVRRRLDRLEVEAVGHPSLRALLGAKRDELGAQVALLECREADGFTAASVRLFGGADPSLIADALEILGSVPDVPVTGPMAGADAVLAAARATRERYASLAPGFDFPIEMLDDTDSVLAVHHGCLQIDAHLSIPAARVAPLIAHEVGVHVITRHNGRQQPLRLLESGLAHYDVLQEGLATLAEYLEGCFPPRACGPWPRAWWRRISWWAERPWRRCSTCCTPTTASIPRMRSTSRSGRAAAAGSPRTRCTWRDCASCSRTWPPAASPSRCSSASTRSASVT